MIVVEISKIRITKAIMMTILKTPTITKANNKIINTKADADLEITTMEIAVSDTMTMAIVALAVMIVAAVAVEVKNS